VQFVTCAGGDSEGVGWGGYYTVAYYGEQLYQKQLMYYGSALMGTGLMF
jgi:hypothetical protein